MNSANDMFLKVNTMMLREIRDSYYQQIYIYLKKNTNIAGFASKSYACMAEETGMSKSKVISVIKDLVSLGYVKKEAVVTASGCLSSNRYYVCDCPEFWKDSGENRESIFTRFMSGDVSGTGTYSFVPVPYDLMDNPELKPYEKSLYIALLKYKNSITGLICPSLSRLADDLRCCVKTVHKYIEKLCAKGLISRETYFTAASGKRALSKYSLKIKNRLKAKSSPDSPPPETSGRKRKKKRKSLPPGYVYMSDDEVKEYFYYDDTVKMAADKNIEEKYIAAAFEIIRHELNSSDKTFRYDGEDMPRSYLRARFERLTPYDIIDAVKIYLSQYNRIKYPEQYLRTLLIRQPLHSTLDMANEVNCILYGDTGYKY